MNAGKLIAQIAVVVIVAYCCYGAIATSVPTSMDELKQLSANPLEVDSPTFSGSCDGMTFEMNVSGGQVVSHLPASVADVYVSLYVGSGELKLNLGTIELGTLVPDEPSAINGTVSAPVYAILAYAAVTEDADGNMAIPLCIEVGFKYFEWSGSYLLDLSVTIKNTIPFEGIAPEVTLEDGGLDAKVSITVDKDKGGLIEDAAKTLKDEYGAEYFDSEGYATITCGEANIKISFDTSNPGEPKITFIADGSNGKTAAELMKEAVNEDGTLNLTLLGVGGNPDMAVPPLSAENVDTFLLVIQTMYDMGGVAI